MVEQLKCKQNNNTEKKNGQNSQQTERYGLIHNIYIYSDEKSACF